MFYQSLFLGLLSALTVSAQTTFSLDTASFPLPDKSSFVLYSSSIATQVLPIQFGAPELLITTDDGNAEFLALMAYNVTTPSQNLTNGGVVQDGTTTRWCWLQADLERMKPTEYQETPQIYLDNSTKPIVPYEVPSLANGTSYSFTIQVWQQTPELLAYLSTHEKKDASKIGEISTKDDADKAEFLLKAFDLLTFSPEVVGNSTLMSIPRASIDFTVVSSDNTTISWSAPSDVGWGTSTGQSNNAQRGTEDGSSAGSRLSMLSESSLAGLIALVTAALVF